MEVTFADLLTAAGAGIAATIVTLAVDVIKAGLAKTPIGSWDGVMMAFVLSAVLYVLAGIATSVSTLDAGLAVFIAWLTCASAAVGVHKVVVNPIVAQIKNQS
jgi:predicted membrane protein